MMRAWLLLVMLVFVCARAAAAQNDCGDGLPCGPIPWSLPVYPDLRSPTPMPTLLITQQSGNPGGTPTRTPTPTVTATPQPTLALDVVSIDRQLATLNAVMAATNLPVLNDRGTPVNTSAEFNRLGQNAGTFFGYARGLTETSMGKITPLITFTFTALLVVLTVTIITFMLPLIAAVFGVVRKIVSTVMEFIPL